MEEIKAPKKERKFLRAMGDIGLALFRELLLGVGKKIINKVGNKRQGLVIAFVMVAAISYAAIDSIPFPITGNKQRLGWQTTGNGLVYRGTAADTVTKPSNYTNKDIKAYLLVDTVNNVMYNYIASKGGWQFNNTDTVIINNNFAQPTDSLFFKTSVTTNNVDTAKMRWDADLATVVLGMYDKVPNELGFKNFWLVKNQTGSTITKNSIVYANGTVGASGRITVAKFIANGTIDAKYLLGITAHDLSNGEDGYVISFGKIRQVNTDTFVAGSILYPSPTVAGVWTDVEPVAPNIDMPIGFCINSHANNGTIAINVASGYALHELHDVAITSPVDRASLYYRGGIWRDTTVALLTSDTASMLTNYLRTGVAASTYQPILVSGTNIKTVNSNNLLGSGNISVGTVTSVSGSGAISSSGGTTPVISVADAAFGTPGIVTSSGTQQFSGDKVFEGITQFNGRALFKDYTYVATRLGGLSSTDRFATVTIGTGLALASGTLSATGGSGTVTNVSAASPANGLSVATGTTTPVISMELAASGTIGVVSATTQTFSGNKTFANNLATSGTFSATGFSTLTGGASVGTMATQANITHVLGVDASNQIGELGLGVGMSVGSGVLSVQAAGASATGLVTSTGSQTFGGNKTFNGTVTLASATGTATSVVGRSSTGQVVDVTLGTGLSLASGTLSATGTVTSVTASSPLSSSGGANPNITITDASISAKGVITTGTQSFAGDKTFTGLTAMNKALQRPVETITVSNTSITTSNTWVIVNHAGTVTLTFPSASASTGTEFHIKTVTNNTVISASSNIVPIAGGSASTSILSATAGKYVTLVSDGTNWVIMQAN